MKNWEPEKYLAPYTALIGPSMSGKTRLLMQLSQTMCVIYLCLRPHNSTRIPPRSARADEMQSTRDVGRIAITAKTFQLRDPVFSDLRRDGRKAATIPQN